jgi:hypothetical protein
MITFDKIGNKSHELLLPKRSKWLKSTQEVLEIGSHMFIIIQSWHYPHVHHLQSSVSAHHHHLMIPSLITIASHDSGSSLRRLGCFLLASAACCQ